MYVSDLKKFLDLFKNFFVVVPLGNKIPKLRGIKSLVREEFTLERTNQTTSEELWFSTEIKNDGDVTVYIDTVFLRLKKGNTDVEGYGLQAHQSVVTLRPGESNKRVVDG